MCRPNVNKLYGNLITRPGPIQTEPHKLHTRSRLYLVYITLKTSSTYFLIVCFIILLTVRPAWLGYCVNRRTLCQETIARWHTGILCKAKGSGDFVRRVLLIHAAKDTVVRAVSRENIVRRKRLGRHPVCRMLAVNLQNAVRKCFRVTR